MNSKQSLLAKILVPVCIALLILGIWIIKNKPFLKEEPLSPPVSESVVEGEAETGVDFSLAANEEVDFAALAAYGLPVIVDYGSDSCIPCQQMAPVLVSLNAEFAGKAFIKFVDVWKYGSAASNVPVQVIPTQVLFNADGTPFMPSEELSSQIKFSMYSHKESKEHVFTVHQGGLTDAQMRAILKEMGVE